jgi:hypothetical protein
MNGVPVVRGSQFFRDWADPPDADETNACIGGVLRCIPLAHILAMMSLKNATCFAIVGTAMWTVLTAVILVRNISGVAGGFMAAITLLIPLIQFVTALSLLWFFIVFRRSPP